MTSCRPATGTTTIRRWSIVRPSAETRARRRRTRAICAARCCGSSRWRRSRRARRQAWGRPTARRRPTCSPATTTHETRPEIFAMGFRQPFTVHADPTKPDTVVVGEYCHDNAANAGRPRARGHVRVEPDRQARVLRLAVLRRRQRAGAHDDPLGLHDQLVDRAEVRLLAELDAVGHPLRPAGRRQRQLRADQRRSGRDPGAGRAGDDLEVAGQRAADIGVRRPRRRRDAADQRPDLPLERPARRQRRPLPGLLGRRVADPQPRRRQRLLEGGPPAQGQQQDAARPELPARQQLRRPQPRPRDRDRSSAPTARCT